MMKVIIGCEFSQVITKAFRKKGHEAYSCDLISCEGGHPEWHIRDDVLKHLDDGWDIGIFHPDCTFLANCGVQWISKRDEWKDMEKAAIFFNKLLHSKIKKKSVENPIQHGYARQIIRKYDQIIQPWMFGHGEQKAICLWLVNLPKLTPTCIVKGREQRIWKMPPSHNRGKLRSIFYPGIGDAMAEQWG